MLSIGLIVLRYNFTLSCSLKFVQHLKHFEHLVSVLGHATEVTLLSWTSLSDIINFCPQVLVRDFNCNAMVMELVREISRIDSRELGRKYLVE